MAIDREGEPHVAIIDGGGRLVYGRQVGQGWDLTPVDLVGRAGLRLLGFALGPSGAAHLSYRTALPASRYATNACGDWRIFDVGEDGPVGSLAVHAHGRVSIAFERGESSIWLARSGR